MTWIKICGITNLEDALVAVEAGADAVGFVFHEKSPRKVDVETARAIVAQLPERVEKVGVFVEQSVEEIADIRDRAGLTAVQVPGIEPPDHRFRDVENFKMLVASSRLIVTLRAESVRDSFLVREKVQKQTYAVLIDSGTSSLPGGTGTTFDWQEMKGMIQAIACAVPVIVAGGLRPGNVRKAIGTLQPFGVDVASGVEARPGKKDPEKLRAFVMAVREVKSS